MIQASHTFNERVTFIERVLTKGPGYNLHTDQNCEDEELVCAGVVEEDGQQVGVVLLHKAGADQI
jgi:hypothetical protein